MIEFKCGQCGAEMEAPQSQAGGVERCPQCGSPNRVPKPARPAAVAHEPPAELSQAAATVPHAGHVSNGPAARPGSRECPFCRQAVDPRASRCPHCSAEIGRLQDCVQCPNCREMVCPTKVVATNEKGLMTDIAKLGLGGEAFLPATEETYTACPVCKAPIAYCSKCGNVTTSQLSRHWVGIGRTKSGYQYSIHCSRCGRKISGPSCFVATQIFATTLDANLLTLYNLRDNWLARSRFGRVLIRAYYRTGTCLALYCKSHLTVQGIIGAFMRCVIRVYRYRLGKSERSGDNLTASGRPPVRPG
jgi:DNA-directed RNA polymerase subunit RPC12/RpoP